MKKNLFSMLFLWLIFSHSGLAESNTADQCVASFSESTFYQSGNEEQKSREELISIYEDAKRREDVQAGAYALIGLCLLTPEDYQLSFANELAIRKYQKTLTTPMLVKHIQNLEKTEKQAVLKTMSPEHLYRVAQAFGLSSLVASKDIFGQKISLKNRALKFIKSGSRDFMWILGPFFFRTVFSYLRDLERIRSVDKLRDRLLQTIHSHPVVDLIGFGGEHLLAKKLGISHKGKSINANSFLQKVVKEGLGNRLAQRLRFEHQYLGKVIRPALLSLMLSLSSVHPYDLAQLYVASKHEQYPLTQMLSDIEQKTPISTQDKKVAVIADNSFISNNRKPFQFIMPIDLDANSLPALQKETLHAKSLESTTVNSIEDLNSKLHNYHNVDTLFIIAHGTPGDFLIGNKRLSAHFEKIDENILKSGANIIFISCSFGDSSDYIEEKNEMWIRLSNRILSNGQAVASTREILLPLKIVDVPEFQRKIEILKPVSSFFRTIEHGVTGPVRYIANILDHLNRHNKFPAGIRVYDSTSDSVEFFEMNTTSN